MYWRLQSEFASRLSTLEALVSDARGGLGPSKSVSTGRSLECSKVPMPQADRQLSEGPRWEDSILSYYVLTGLLRLTYLLTYAVSNFEFGSIRDRFRFR